MKIRCGPVGSRRCAGEPAERCEAEKAAGSPDSGTFPAVTGTAHAAQRHVKCVTPAVRDAGGVNRERRWRGATGWCSRATGSQPVERIHQGHRFVQAGGEGTVEEYPSRAVPGRPLRLTVRLRAEHRTWGDADVMEEERADENTQEPKGAPTRSMPVMDASQFSGWNTSPARARPRGRRGRRGSVVSLQACVEAHQA